MQHMMLEGCSWSPQTDERTLEPILVLGQGKGLLMIRSATASKPHGRHRDCTANTTTGDLLGVSWDLRAGQKEWYRASQVLMGTMET